MPRAHANGIDIEYETFGAPAGRPLLLIMGLGTQMVSWPDEFCRRLASTGHYVVRFDNRDVGLSTHFDRSGTPDFERVAAAALQGLHPGVPYGLSDMALDALGLMDALEIAQAHVCGLSMGGYIAQIMAIDHPQRLLSVISMESSSGARDLPPSRPGVREALMQPAPFRRQGYIDYMVNLHRMFSGGSQAFDPLLQAEIAGRSYDRAFHPAGVARHIAAVLAAGSRQQALRSVRLPALVIHGDADTLLPWEHGKATADAIPGAEFVLVGGLGHGMAYPGLWDEIIAAVTAHTDAGSRPKGE